MKSLKLLLKHMFVFASYKVQSRIRRWCNFGIFTSSKDRIESFGFIKKCPSNSFKCNPIQPAGQIKKQTTRLLPRYIRSKNQSLNTNIISFKNNVLNYFLHNILSDNQKLNAFLSFTSVSYFAKHFHYVSCCRKKKLVPKMHARKIR